MRVTIWNEFLHEKESEEVKKIYPNGIHDVIANYFSKDEKIEVCCATLSEDEHGLTQYRIDHTDVLIWWGHRAHNQVSDEVVERVYQAVLKGMGLIVLHSGHFSKIFKKLMGTSCDLLWRDQGEKERVWVVSPSHPIVKGIPSFFELEKEEMYGEFFDIPTPDELILLGWFQGGEVFRSGCCYHRGKGKIFYFQPGHELFPIYYHPHVKTIIKNAVQWAAPIE